MLEQTWRGNSPLKMCACLPQRSESAIKGRQKRLRQQLPTEIYNVRQHLSVCSAQSNMEASCLTLLCEMVLLLNDETTQEEIQQSAAVRRAAGLLQPTHSNVHSSPWSMSSCHA